MRSLALAVLVLFMTSAHADWQFSAPIDVLKAEAGRFPELGAANRQGVAESAGIIAVAWQESSDGVEQCHVRFKMADAKVFADDVTLPGKSCGDPVIVGLGEGHFLAGWQADQTVWVARLNPGKLDTPLKISHAPAGQVTLAYDSKGGLHAAWVEQASSGSTQLWIGTLDISQDGLHLVQPHTVENIIPVEDQAYPALVVNPDGSLVVVWEDRRFDHTVLLVSHSRDGKRFDLPYRLIDVHGMPGGPASRLGGGMGAMRPTLASCGSVKTDQTDSGSPGFCVVAVWMDKRDFLSGYDVYAAFSHDGGKTFGRNLKVQDGFGDNIAQWHAAVGANRQGRVAAVWDDNRDGTSDIWLADWTGSAFSPNIDVPAASGPGIQTDPMIFLDDADRLHVIWLDRADENASPQIRYVSAVWKD
jgi:hypothetical protein